MSPPSATIVPGGRGLPIRCKSKEVQRNMVFFTFSVSVPRTFVHYCGFHDLNDIGSSSQQLHLSVLLSLELQANHVAS